MTDAPSPERLHDSLTGRVERWLLERAADRLPVWVTPDHLTGLGVLGSFVVLAGYALSNCAQAWLWLANLGLVIHWFGDSMDGTLARRRRIERPRYGFFIDQTLDALTNCVIAAGIGLSPVVSFGAAMLALAGYQMISIYAFVRAVVLREFIVSSLGFGPTELRLCIVIFNLLILCTDFGTLAVFGVTLSWYDLPVLLMGLSFLISFLFHVRATSRRLLVLDAAERRDGAG